MTPLGVLDARALSRTPKRGMELVNLRELGIIPGVFGGDRGIHAQGDIVTSTSDGVNLNDLWNAYQEGLTEANRLRDPVVALLTRRTTLESEPFFSTGARAEFEEASEYGEPVGHRPTQAHEFLGYTFKWYDLAARFTWMYLANAPANQVDATAAMALEADNRNVFNLVMKTVFNNTRRTNEKGTTVYPWYAGVAGDLPPAVGSTTFADSHNHFVTTGTATLTAASVENLYDLIAEHGYKAALGYRHVLLVNKAEADYMRNWRSAANGGTSPATGGGLYDFVPAQGTPSFLVPDNLRIENASQPPSTYQGMTVVGQYGNWLVVEEEYIPAGYLVGFATGGPENVQNPVVLREHPNASLRGLRLVKGRTPDYPLIDSFYNRGIGSGINTRGAGAVLQVDSGATYSVPAAYAW